LEVACWVEILFTSEPVILSIFSSSVQTYIREEKSCPSRLRVLKVVMEE
jgi:hypothetical protein